MDRLERAREFVDHEVFTDGQGRNAGRLVMEFESGQYAGTGWSKGPIVNKFVAFAASEVRAERARIAGRLRSAMRGGQWPDGDRIDEVIEELEEQDA